MPAKTAAVKVAERLRAQYDPEDPGLDLYADDLVSWHNYDEQEIALTREQLGAKARMEHGALNQVVRDLRHEERAVYPAGDAVVMTQVMVGTLPDGAALRVPACHVYSLEDGRIARMDVYLDSAQLAPIARAFAEHGVEFKAPE